ncbi:MAG TPA: hypothetical protein VG317_03925 [Pseudonocardiaceae bacterium]|jgi:hypothetical protein|nr:hypothetical protein [Pseudonocardiaceae bacterium]
MNRTEQSFPPRTAQYSLGFGVVFLAIAALTEKGGTASEPCQQSLPVGVPHLWGVSEVAIAFGWFGTISALISLASAGLWLIASLRERSGQTRWTYGGWLFFLFFPIIILIINIINLNGFYTNAVGRIADCV